MCKYNYFILWVALISDFKLKILEAALKNTIQYHCAHGRNAYSCISTYTSPLKLFFFFYHFSIIACTMLLSIFVNIKIMIAVEGNLTSTQTLLSHSCESKDKQILSIGTNFLHMNNEEVKACIDNTLCVITCRKVRMPK